MSRSSGRSLIGPCEGSCGQERRGRIQPVQQVGDRWLCHQCASSALDGGDP